MGGGLRLMREWCDIGMEMRLGYEEKEEDILMILNDGD